MEGRLCILYNQLLERSKNMVEEPHARTLFERYIKSKDDMAAAENVIVRYLGGENNRCAFFRSKPYMQLRLAALYPARVRPVSHVALCGQLSVSLCFLSEGPLVTVLWQGGEVEIYKPEETTENEAVVSSPPRRRARACAPLHRRC